MLLTRLAFWRLQVLPFTQPLGGCGPNWTQVLCNDCEKRSGVQIAGAQPTIPTALLHRGAIGQVSEGKAAGVETKDSEFSNLLMACDF